MKQPCCICGYPEFSFTEVLWRELITAWQLSYDETNYINRQQGLCCKRCGSNLRSMALARAIMFSFKYEGVFSEFVEAPPASRIHVLEINEAGSLTPLLSKMPLHRLVQYPDFDMTNLDLPSGEYDLVVHSDTLEHVPNPVAGLTECRRVLKGNGYCMYTIPVIVDRLTRSRSGLCPSYHGSSTETDSGLIVHTEYGADMWKQALLAGFSSIAIHCLEYPAGMALIAQP